MTAIYLGEKKTAVFFELDGVVRRLKADVAREIHAKTGLIPPAPFGTGMQELIWPVVNHIRALCETYGSTPVGIDMAPYISDGAALKSQGLDPGFDIDDYKIVVAETKQLLMLAGLPEPKILSCPHRAKETKTFTVSGKQGQSSFEPQCHCRLPNNALILQACVQLGLGHAYKDGILDVHSTDPGNLEPSIFITKTDDARRCAIDKCGMSTLRMEAIMDGTVYIREHVTSDHLKLVEKIKEFNRAKGLTGDISTGTREISAAVFNDFPTLPPGLARPTVSLRNDRT